MAEGLVLGHLDGEDLALTFFERPARPEDHALVIRIAGGDALGEEVAPLAPGGSGRAGGTGEGQRGADRRGAPDELAAAGRHDTTGGLASSLSYRRSWWS